MGIETDLSELCFQKSRWKKKKLKHVWEEANWQKNKNKKIKISLINQ